MSAFSLDMYVRDIIHHYLTSSRLTVSAVLDRKSSTAHHAKTDLNKKLLPKQKTNQTFNIDAQGFRKTINENPPKREIGVTS